MKCINCAAEFPIGFCLNGGQCEGQADQPENEVGAFTKDDFGLPETPKEMLDPISTGRKRAARMYAIAPGTVCEWAWKKNAGGGIVPIFGCPGRPAVHIHHGPDKSTLNNDRSNISLVCNFCHNRWHVANDGFYDEPRPKDNSAWLPRLPDSDPESVIHTLDEIQKATKNEILMAELLIPEGGKDKK